MEGTADTTTLAGAVKALRNAPSRRAVNRIEAAFAVGGATPEEVALLAEVAAIALDRIRASDDARRDPLTGVLNRRGFVEASRERVTACPGPVAVGLFDVDGLKAINDRYGHAAGSATLRAAADAIQGAFGDAVVGRIGGDEFAALVLDRSDVGVLRGRLEATVRGRAAMADVVRLELSAGYATGIATRQAEVDRLLAEADAELYAGRRARRDTASRFLRRSVRSLDRIAS
jgi:diguanylate cyclase (GGDEF)-like protein